MNHTKLYVLATFLLLLASNEVTAQISGMWPNSQFDMPMTDFSMSLKGNVKTWTITKDDGESRTMTYDKTGKQLSDSFTGTQQSYIPPDFQLIKWKNEYEKAYPQNSITDTNLVFNEKQQLIERKGPNGYEEKNVFNASGQIRMHRRTSSSTETRAWNSLHHKEPTYTYTNYHGELLFYRYNGKGSLTEVEYFDSDPFLNVKLVYIYNDKNQLIETNRHDNYNIYGHYKTDNYLSEILATEVDTSFSIESVYEHYWKQGSPSVNKWKFNELGQKVEYTAYGYKKGLSFKAEWEYDEKGSVLKETHWNVYKNQISRIFDFDKHGNVIREQSVGYEGVKDVIWEVKIEYW